MKNKCFTGRFFAETGEATVKGKGLQGKKSHPSFAKWQFSETWVEDLKGLPYDKKSGKIRWNAAQNKADEKRKTCIAEILYRTIE